ncbi:oxidoreductase [Tothia fuscella]|uniref:Oxidoreductase n=1 Tax=Tothia fuscella TaxID=1048955 RepID=A0A9P4P134_9PEZI|nr:oxidoreductase [Tothia fuscella]
MSNQNQAAWIKKAKATPLEIDTAPYHEPGPNQILIKNGAVAINPVDWKIQNYGFMVQKYPAILGEDIAGEVVGIGAGVTRFKKGDRVISHCLGLATGKPEHAGFQLYSVGFEDMTAHIPSSVSYEDASVLPLAISTAASGLYTKDYLHLPYPTKDHKPLNKVIFVYGASSAVGCAAVQLAVASGLTVIATASKRNTALVESLGATKVLDYTNKNIVEEAVTELKKHGEFVGVYESISEPGTIKICASIVGKMGGGFMACTLEPPKDLPQGVSATWCFAPSIHMKEPEVANAVWGDYIPQALSDGSFQAKPDAIVVGTGLESIQQAFERHKQRVSGAKIVVKI